LRLTDDQPLDFIESRSLYTVFLLEPENQKHDSEDNETAYKVIVPLPRSINRIIWLPASENEKQKLYFILLEDVILTWGAYLFPGFKVKEGMVFKIDRDADFSVDEQRDEDFVEAMEKVLEDRDKSNVIRMAYSPGSNKLKDELAQRFSLTADDLYQFDGPMSTADFLGLINVAGLEELNEKPWKIQQSNDFSDEVSIWDRISQSDVMLHLPYQSFDPVVRFFQDAAVDPDVISIKTALYRTGGAIPGTGNSESSSAYSPVVRALEQAALNGKHVMALVELKARFDEERNISWANRLVKAGVIVVYGLSHLKVHSKVSMVMRRENDRVKRYVHLSTGNYNDRTAKYYEDICLFTCREDIAYDAGLLFNMLSGYSTTHSMVRLAAAPNALKRRLLELIERETNRAKQKYPGKIMAKFNSLTDTDIIQALYKASSAGVKISLCVRGICTLVPGIPDISENIHVISVIDHYLEHSRIFYFANGGAEELYLSSADWMSRNLDRRVELMFPVLDEKLSVELRDILHDYFRDNIHSSIMDSNGNWTRIVSGEGEVSFRVQKEMLSRAARLAEKLDTVKQEYIVRRSPPADKI
jgi:polyphosphate kinase